MEYQNKEETTDFNVKNKHLKSSNERPGAGKGTKTLPLEERQKMSCGFGKDDSNKDVDTQKESTGWNAPVEEFSIENAKFERELEEKKVEDASPKILNDFDNLEKTNAELRGTIDLYEKIILTLIVAVYWNKKIITEQREKLARGCTLKDLLKPKPPKDGSPRESNPRHRRLKTFPPSSFTEPNVE